MGLRASLYSLRCKLGRTDESAPGDRRRHCANGGQRAASCSPLQGRAPADDPAPTALNATGWFISAPSTRRLPPAPISKQLRALCPLGIRRKHPLSFSFRCPGYRFSTLSFFIYAFSIAINLTSTLVERPVLKVERRHEGGRRNRQISKEIRVLKESPDLFGALNPTWQRTYGTRSTNDRKRCMHFRHY